MIESKKAWAVSLSLLADTRCCSYLLLADRLQNINLREYGEMQFQYKQRQKLFPKYRIDKFWVMPDERLECEKSIFSVLGGFVLINGKAFEVLKKYSLGSNDLIRVIPYDEELDKDIEVDDVFYLLNIAETNEYCDLEKSKNISWWEDSFEELTPYEKPDLLEDGFTIDSAVSDSGIDLWADSRLQECFFISDRLKNALDDAGISQDWLLTRCVVI